MLNTKQSVDLTPQQIEVIQSALHTQEKILSVQSRAGGDGSAGTRLSELKQVLATLRRQQPDKRGTGLIGFARTLFG